MSDLKETVRAVRQYSRDLVRELDMLKGVFQDTGFTYSECHVLFELNQHKILNLMELASLLRLDKSNASRLLSTLTGKGLIAVEEHPTDKRQKRFSLTEAGKVAVSHNNCLADDEVSGALALLTTDDRAQLAEGLHKYAKALRHSRQQKAFVFRPIQREDNAKVARLIREVMTEFGCVGEGYSINDAEVDAMYEAYSHEKSAFWVITKQGEILGGGGIAPLPGEETTTCELKKMYFYPAIRGVGLGMRMVNQLLDQARSLGYQKCYLETVERMWQANLLYRKMGFEPLQSCLGQTGHCSCDAWYVKTL